MLSTGEEERDIYENYGKTCFTIIRLGFCDVSHPQIPSEFILVSKE